MTNKHINEVNDNTIIQVALDILEKRISYNTESPVLTSPQASKDYCKLKLAEKESEVFAVIFLDTQHKVIAYEELFQGTINGASVHPREVVRKTLKHNAAALILVHNHPSGIAEPSSADKAITIRLQDALGLIDVKTLDHLVVGSEVVSFAERGLI